MIKQLSAFIAKSRSKKTAPLSTKKVAQEPQASRKAAVAPVVPPQVQSIVDIVSPNPLSPILPPPELTSTKTDEGHHYFVVMRGAFHTSCSVHSTVDDKEYVKELVKNRFIATMGTYDLFPVVESMEITEET